MFNIKDRDMAIIKAETIDICCEKCRHCREDASGLACGFWCCSVDSNEMCSDFERAA